MNTRTVRARVVYQDANVRLEALESTEISALCYTVGGFCHVQFKPLALIVHQGGSTQAFDIQGNKVDASEIESSFLAGD